MRRVAVRNFVAGLLSMAPALGATEPALADRTPPMRVESAVEGTVARVELGLGGRLVAALAPNGHEIFLLVRPEAEVDGPRRLVALHLGDGSSAPAAEEIVPELGGWTKTLAALELGRGPELVVGGLGRLDSLGPLDASGGARIAGRKLVEDPGLDLRSMSPGLLRIGVERGVVATEVGALRIWRSDGAGALELAETLTLPFAVQRQGNGLELEGPPVTELAPTPEGRRRFVAGPQTIGARLRLVLIEEGADGTWQRSLRWAALPAYEEVEESWLGEIEGAPALVVRTQGAAEVNAFEKQRWRAYRLAEDRTRAGRGPGLAVEVDSKRWHDNEALLADADGDGKTDVLIARPEGMTGGDLVVEAYPGEGAGRFDRSSRRTDIDDAPDRFELLADADGTGRPGLVGVGESWVSLWRFAVKGRKALERDPLLRATWKRPEPPAPPPGEKASRWTHLRWVGAVPVAGAPPRLLVLASPEKGEDRLLVFGSAAP
jgi:hypothetical protein